MEQQQLLSFFYLRPNPHNIGWLLRDNYIKYLDYKLLTKLESNADFSRSEYLNKANKLTKRYVKSIYDNPDNTVKLFDNYYKNLFKLDSQYFQHENDKELTEKEKMVQRIYCKKTDNTENFKNKLKIKQY